MSALTFWWLAFLTSFAVSFAPKDAAKDFAIVLRVLSIIGACGCLGLAAARYFLKVLT